MKIYEHIKYDNKSITKIFGISILEKTSDYINLKRIQKFFYGIITTVKIDNFINLNSIKIIKIFNKPIIKIKEENNYRTFYLFDKKIKKTSLLKLFKKNYFKYFDKKYDDIYILNANSGESYLTLAYLFDLLIKKNNSKHPLLALTKEYHLDMVRMINPDIPCVLLRNKNFYINDMSFKIDNFRFFILYTNSYYNKIENDIKTAKIGDAHYFKSLLKELDLNNDFKVRKINQNEADYSNMLKKISKTGLNLDNFVLLAPEANSCKLYDEDFWLELIKNLKEKGYDVFVNLMEDNNFHQTENFKTCKLSFAELFALAKKAKRIVSLRSGLVEFLLQTNVPIDILYTKFRRRHFFNDMDIYHVMSGFKISDIPFVNKTKIREFNTFEMSAKDCISTILERL